LGLAVSSCSLTKDRVEQASVDPVVRFCAEGKVTQGQSTVCVDDETVRFKPINLDTFRFDDRPDELAIVAASGDPTYRNRLQALAFDRSIAACAQHLRFAFASTALRKGILQFGAIATDAAAVLVGGTLAKESLAAASGVLSASDSIIDSVQFQNLLLASIMKAIDNDRNSETIAAYSVEEALEDITDYHRRCSTVHGIMLLSESVEELQRNNALISDLERRQIETQAEELAEQIDQLDSAKNKKQIEILQERLDRLRADLPAPKAPAGAAGAATRRPGRQEGVDDGATLWLQGNVAPEAQPIQSGATMSRTVYVNGAYLPEEEAKISVFDRGFLFADGVYEVATVVDGRLVDNAAHLARLQRSLGELDMPAPAAPEEIEAIQRELIARNGIDQGLVYLQVTRGAADRDFLYPKDAAPSLVMFTQTKNVIDSPAAAKGISVITLPDIRWRRRDIKTVALLAASMAKQAAHDAGADDAWMVEDGAVTEGSSNNAFIVTHDGAIITRALSNDILHGITRRAVLAIAEREGLTVEERAFSPEEAYEAAEAFITSASTFVMPVVKIDSRILGNGVPGPVSENLRRLYIEMARQEAT
jgi:D-alanine transaminase